MKILQLIVLCMLILCTTGARILPQEETPNEPYAQVPESLYADAPPPMAVSPAAQSSTILQSIKLIPQKPFITVAWDSAREYAPRVSSCGGGSDGLYLVVYEDNFDIRGQKLTRNGAKAGSEFVIFDGSAETDKYFDVDVSCEVFKNRFIVVASHLAPSYQSVEAIAVKGTSSPSSELASGVITVVSSLSISYKDSVIACDGDNHYCLVVFVAENASDDVYAQRLWDLNNDPYLTKLGDMFILGNATIDENAPDVAWGGNHDSYLVTWQYYDNTYTHFQLVFSHVKDLEQGNGSVETYHGPIFLFGAHTNHQLSSRIAYNRNEDDYPFIVVFTYDGQGDLSDFDVYAQYVGGNTGTVVDYNNGRLVAAYGIEPLDEAWADVAFAAGTENYYQPNPDQFLVTFICGYGTNGNGALCARPMQASSPYEYTGDWWEYYMIDTSGNDRYIDNTAVIGTIYYNRYLVVWDEQYSHDSEDYDIFASLIAPFGEFIPFIKK